MSSSMAGKTIGKYRVIEQIGRGGMAEVYKAYQPGLDRYVAIKLMHTFLVDDKEFTSRFQREARVVANLRHPNIVQVHDFDVEHDVSYMVMEFIDGETLKDRLLRMEAKGEWMSLNEAAGIVLAVGSALKYAHRQGMVHRDVKPANVMIDCEGRVILTDFGIAKILHGGGGGSQLTASGAMIGTPSYMSPEQGMGQPGDARSDIYSLGVMMYQLVTGRLPYEADTPLAVVIKHIQGPLPMPRTVNPSLPESIERVILRALAKNPDDRYQNVGEMLTDLKQAMGMPLDDTATDVLRTKASHASSVAAKPGTMSTLGARATQVQGAVAPRRNVGLTVLIVVLVIVFLVVAAGGIWLLIKASRPSVAQSQPTATRVQPALVKTAMPSPVSAPTSTAKPSAVMVVISQDGAELRAEPGEGTVLGLLPKGTEMTARSRTPDSTWVKVEAPDGTTGWVKTETLSLGAFSVSDIPQMVVLIKPSATPDLAATQTACKPAAELVQDVTIPDGAQIKAGAQFTKTWRIKNTGNCTFDTGSKLVYKSGDRLSGPEAGVAAPLVKAGDQADISIGLAAPALGGTYSGVWEFRRANGDPIGQVSVRIVVLGPTATRPPTRPPAATATPVAPPTDTPVPGAGPVGSGPLTASWAGNFYNCVSTLATDENGNNYWIWNADFYIEVYGGSTSYTISSPDCYWTFGAQPRFDCRWGARGGGTVSQAVTVTSGGESVRVGIQAAAERFEGGSCTQK